MILSYSVVVFSEVSIYEHERLFKILMETNGTITSCPVRFDVHGYNVEKVKEMLKLETFRLFMKHQQSEKYVHSWQYRQD